MKYLITGAAGFIGMALAERLRAQGHEVVSTDNGWRYGNRGTLSVDVTQYEEVKAVMALTKPDGVFHLAAINGTRNFYERPAEVLEVGLLGILNVVRAMEYEGTKKLWVASSSEVYQSVEGKANESVPFSCPDPLNPRYSYAVSKMASEVVAVNSKVEEVYIVRPHNVYGPNCGEQHVIPQFIRRAQGHRKGTPFLVQGDADQSRAFCYIDDFLDGLDRVVGRGRNREIYHIGTEDERSIASIARDVCRGVCGYDVELTFGEGARGGPPRRCPDTAKLQGLGWSQQVSWEDGLLKTINFFGGPVESKN